MPRPDSIQRLYVLQAELQVALSEAKMQKSLNQQLMDRKQEMEWQLLEALSKVPNLHTSFKDT